MRAFAIVAFAAALAVTATPVLAGQGCLGYKSAKVTYPATALEPAAPQTPVPSSGSGG